jgi:hypothetical protein
MTDTTESAPLLPIRILEQARENVHITISEFHRQTRLDLRHYVESDARPGMPIIPTKKGINLPLYELPKLIDELLELQAAARAVGILAEDDTV